MQCHRARGDRKPQALAACGAMFARGIDAVERLEDQREILLRHARTRSLDRRPRCGASAWARARGAR